MQLRLVSDQLCYKNPAWAASLVANELDARAVKWGWGYVSGWPAGP